METTQLDHTEVSVCEKCEKRFECYTNRWNYDGLCKVDNFLKLDRETIKQIQIAKAKRQGHYYPTE